MSAAPRESEHEPRKAYWVEWTITNGMGALVYADSAAEAERIAPFSPNADWTGEDGRAKKPKARRERERDR